MPYTKKTPVRVILCNRKVEPRSSSIFTRSLTRMNVLDDAYVWSKGYGFSARDDEDWVFEGSYQVLDPVRMTP